MGILKYPTARRWKLKLSVSAGYCLSKICYFPKLISAIYSCVCEIITMCQMSYAFGGCQIQDFGKGGKV